MAETRSPPEVTTSTLPTLDVQYENKFKDYELSDITHIVIHLSDTHIRNIMNSNTDISNEYGNQGYLDIVRKMLSVTFFGNENQLEWLGTERLGRRKFVAFTNIKNKEKWVQNQSLRYGKLKMVEVMFMRTNPRETQKIFWRPARKIVFRHVLIKVRNSVEKARVRAATTRAGMISQKLAYRLRKCSASV
ncbi:hypothetical protein N7519_002626 [Penicillium mononematosum]|uniref:uncharacterized protein n=1 Tax=Penicillium mononematosum TaxID=268346 RepID=UPI00254978AB|nr:uncharacterized protein N7519_002626 [Penicillium mononematosum]KAJ6187718.1 hypothetical protein N7519_002626 [Penicillium mononematosum]